MSQQPEEALLLEGTVLLELNQVEPAIDKLQVATNQPNATAAAFARLSDAFAQAGQFSQARLTLVQGSQRFPTEPGLQQQLNEDSTQSNHNKPTHSD